MNPKKNSRLIPANILTLLIGVFVCILFSSCAQNKIRTYDNIPYDETPNVEVSPKKVTPKDLPVKLFPKTYWTETPIAVPSEADPMGAITRITVHHDGLPKAMVNTHAKIAERILEIYHGHIKQGWADIGYHFIIDPLGRVWEGRPLTYQGAHVKDNNENNIGILVLGNFQYTAPSKQAKDTLFKLMRHLMDEYQITWNQIYTHRELVPNQSNECPGRYLQIIIDKARQSGGLLTSQ